MFTIAAYQPLAVPNSLRTRTNFLNVDILSGTSTNEVIAKSESG